MIEDSTTHREDRSTPRPATQSTEKRAMADLQQQPLVNPAMLAAKRVVFVGGISESTTASIVRAAFIPFGDIKSVDLPMNYEQGTHRGFAFVEYEEPDDAEEAIFNMDGAELAGRTIAVSVAQPNQLHKMSSGASSSEAIWKSDEWFQRQMKAGNPSQQSAEELAKLRERENDAQTLQET